MKNLLVALTLVLTATAVNASNSNVKFVATDNSVESNLCVLAAEEGYKAAMKQAGNSKASLTTCNGQSIRNFSKTYQIKSVAAPKTVLIVPANNSTESKVCAQAVKSGIKAATQSLSFDVNHITCNGKSLTRFVKQYSNS
jgi:hypothetical protein